MKYRALLATGVLAMTCGAAHAQDEPGQLHRLTKPGAYQAAPGDLIVVAMQSNPSTGPANPAAKLKVEVKGTGLAAKSYVVFVPPAKPIPGAPGEIHAYVPVDAVGNATLTVTPISGTGQAGRPMEFTIKVSEDGARPQ